MGDEKMADIPDEELVDYNDPDPFTNKGDLSQNKYGDEVYYEPFTPKLPRGSVEDVMQRLRVTGLRLRKDLNRSLLTDQKAWTALRRPASIHTSQRTLAEMLMSVPSADQDHFRELGDGYVYMPLQAMEKYLYPTLRMCDATSTQA